MDADATRHALETEYEPLLDWSPGLVVKTLPEGAPGPWPTLQDGSRGHPSQELHATAGDGLHLVACLVPYAPRHPGALLVAVFPSRAAISELTDDPVRYPTWEEIHDAAEAVLPKHVWALPGAHYFAASELPPRGFGAMLLTPVGHRSKVVPASQIPATRTPGPRSMS